MRDDDTEPYADDGTSPTGDLTELTPIGRDDPYATEPVTPHQWDRLDTTAARVSEEHPAPDVYAPHEPGRGVVLTVAVMVALIGLGVAFYFALWGSDDGDGPSVVTAGLNDSQVGDVRTYFSRHNQLMLRGAEARNFKPMLRYELSLQDPRVPYGLKRCQRKLRRELGPTDIKLTYPHYDTIEHVPDFRVRDGKYEGVRPDAEVYRVQATLKRGPRGGPYETSYVMRYFSFRGDEGPYLYRNCSLAH